MAALLNRFWGCGLRNTKSLLSSSISCCQNQHVYKSTEKKVKKPATGFAVFVTEQMPIILDELKQGAKYTSNERFRRISEKWWALSEEERKAYRAPPEKWEEYRRQLSEQYVISGSDFKTALAKINNKMNKPKRVNTAFMNYYVEKLGSWSEEKRKEIGTHSWMAVVAEDWKNLSAEEKEVYERKTQEDYTEYYRKLYVWEEEMRAKGFPELCRDYPGSRRKALMSLLERLGWEKPEK